MINEGKKFIIYKRTDAASGGHQVPNLTFDKKDDAHAHIEKLAPGDYEVRKGWAGGTKTSRAELAKKIGMKEEVKEPTGDLKKACWKGYTAVGTKMKNGRKVPNCVPVKEDNEKFTNRVQPENDTPDTDASDREAAVGKIGLRLRGGRDLSPMSDEQKEKMVDFAKSAAGLTPLGLVSTAADTYDKIKQGNYEDAATTAAFGVGSALLGPAAKLAGKGVNKVYQTVKNVVREEVKGKHFTTGETVEKQSKNPNDPDSRFDGTKSAKNVYQKTTPGQPVTENSISDPQAIQTINDRAKVLDQLTQAAKESQNPTVKTSVGQTADRRQFGPQGEIITNVGSRGEKSYSTIPNQATIKKQPVMTNLLTTIKKVVRESYVCENCDCGLHEEILNERGADSKGYFRSTESGAGLTAKGAKHFGVQTAVTEPNPTGKRAARRKSFCARMSGMKGPMKDEKGRPTRKAMSLRRWNCH
jgi:hypothetical protein